MNTLQATPRWWKPIEFAIVLGILGVSAGIVLPVMRSNRIREDEGAARADMTRIRDALLSFQEDTGLGPTRGRDGNDRKIYRLCGPGRVHFSSYFEADEHQGWLVDHLIHNAPSGDRSWRYESWNGPYLDELGPDPWGNAYVVVLYPMFQEDDRDCIVVSAGANGKMDASYASPRDVLPSGDDLIEVIYDKSPEQSEPVF